MTDKSWYDVVTGVNWYELPLWLLPTVGLVFLFFVVSMRIIYLMMLQVDKTAAKKLMNIYRRYFKDIVKYYPQQKYR